MLGTELFCLSCFVELLLEILLHGEATKTYEYSGG